MTDQNKTPDGHSITTGPISGSEKVYVPGKLHPVNVAMREIKITDDQLGEDKSGITVYDTSGPYTDPAIEIDIRKGLPKLREGWVEQRGDTELLDRPGSVYAMERLADRSLDELRFEHLATPRNRHENSVVPGPHFHRRPQRR